MQESVKGDRLLEVMKRSRMVVPGGEENCGAQPNIMVHYHFHYLVYIFGKLL